MDGMHGNDLTGEEDVLLALLAISAKDWCKIC